LNVLILFSTSNIGGAERSLTRMALASTGTDYKLATLGGAGEWSQWVETLGSNPIIFGNGGSTIVRLYRLYQYIKIDRIDAVYICGGKLALIIRLFRWILPDIKIVHGVRHNPASNSRQDRLFRWSEKWFQVLIDGWITNSAAAKEILVKKCNIPEDRISIIYNGIEMPMKRPVAIKKRALEVLTIANMNPRKGYLEYLNVIRRVVSVIPNVKFVFVGRDDMEGDIQRAIIEAGLEQYIRYDGFQKDVTEWYRRARVFALPSLWGEGCPTSVLEALSFGVPVVAYAIDGIPELINTNSDGILVDRKDEQSMADAICKLLIDADVSQEYANTGYEKVSNSFSVESSVLAHDRYWSDL